jgi:hypothetical protein
VVFSFNFVEYAVIEEVFITGVAVFPAHRLNSALPGVRCVGAEMIDQTRELDPVHTGVRRAQQQR